MELALFLLGGIDLSRMEALQKGAAEVNQIKLVMKGILGCCVEDRQGQ